MLAATGIRVQRGGTSLLDAVDCQVHPGELLVVLGPNGAGKSTLLRVLSGELRPSAGRVTLDGHRLGQFVARDLAQRRAVLPQHSTLSFPFRVQDVVAMGRSPHRDPSGTAQDSIVAAAMALADVAHLAGRLYPSLSGGERQRVQLARVLAQIWSPVPAGPRFLLLDEPTAALDIAHQHQLLELARQLVAGGDLGVLAILHDLNLACAYADRILLLAAGRVVTQDRPAAVVDGGHLGRAFAIPIEAIEHPRQPGRRLVITGAAAAVSAPSAP
ncbi:MAG: heme ABC transporter ATP-binding protein [Chromatiaceae bacterium]|nr:MAG: heme ABC transporter ATP-binding protein [Chromatiaceae bacterium]